MARLVYMDAHGQQQIWQIDASRERIVIGRHPDCDLVAPDLGVSRRHCELTRDALGHYRIHDLESQNGTLVNHAPVTEAALKSHDIIRCAGLILQFFEDSSIDASQTYPMEDGSAQATAAAQAAMHAEIERLQRYNESQSNALARLQDALHDQSQALTAAQAELASLRRRDDALLPPTTEMTAPSPGLDEALDEDELPSVSITRTPLKREGTLPEPEAGPLDEARDAGRIIELESALAASQAELAEVKAALAAAELPPPTPTPAPASADDGVALRAEISELQSELNAARAAFMATDAEQVARLAVVERELERTDARLGSAEAVIEQQEDQLAEAQAWLQAAGVRVQAARDELAALEAKLETARSATAEARQSARAAGKLRREVRQAEARAHEAEARADEADGQLMTARSHAAALAQAMDSLSGAREGLDDELAASIDAVVGLVAGLTEAVQPEDEH